MDGLGRPRTVAGSRRLGKAAVLAMLRVARHCPGPVLDSTWYDYALPLARELPGQLAEVHCIVSLDLARARYRARSPTATQATLTPPAARQNCGANHPGF
jgi:hypothetical protein